MKNESLLEDLFFPSSGLQLCESKSQKYKGVIGVVEGPFGITESANRNKRVYTNLFWESVLARSDVQTKITERAMVGEPEHPHSLHARLDRVSHVITKLKLLPEENTVWGRAEILDTPTGRILKTLFDAKVKVGISSRGSGSLTEVGGKNLVKESGYVLGGFDFVSEPSAPNAYPQLSERIVESLSDSNILDQIDREPELVNYYEGLLGKFGVNLGLLREDSSMDTGHTSPEVSKELAESATTIATLRAQVDGLLSRCKDLSIQLEESDSVDLDLEEERQSHTALVEKYDSSCRCLSALRTEKADLENALALAEKSREAILGEQEDHWNEQFREIAVEHARKEGLLETQIEDTEQTVSELKVSREVLEDRISSLRETVNDKNEKLRNFRKSLIEEICPLFQVDPKNILSSLNKGFSPKDLVERVRGVSPILADSSLPLSHAAKKQQLFELVDTAPPQEENDGRPTPGRNFESLVKKT